MVTSKNSILNSFIIFWALVNAINCDSYCNDIPLLEIGEEFCKNGEGIDRFQVKSSKKINWKKPLNGKIKFKFTTNSENSDVLRLKKCIKISPSFFQKKRELDELTAYFYENVPQNEATLLYTNETTILVQLNHEGKIKDGHYLVTPDNFKSFSLCKFADSNVAYECFSIDKSNIDEPKEGFFMPNENISIENGDNKDLYHVNLHSQKQTQLMPLESNLKEQCAHSIKKENRGIQSWLNDTVVLVKTYLQSTTINEVHDYLLTAYDLSKENSDHQFLTIPFPEFDFKWLKRPNIVKLYKGESLVFTGNITFKEGDGGETNGIIDLTNPSGNEKQTVLLDALALKTFPFSIKLFYGEKDNKKHIIIDGEERLTPLGSIIGHVCRNGKLCGHVLKFGLRTRDPVCDIVQNHNLAYVGYHDPISGDSLGPTIHVLVGTSVLYNPHGKLPGKEVAYIFPGARDFATLGSFDKNGILIQGQKVKYETQGCNNYGLPMLKFSKPVEPEVFYYYKPGNNDAFGDQPHVIDELATEYVEIRKIDDYKGDGTFAKKDIPDRTMITQYGGLRLLNGTSVDKKFKVDTQYTQRIGACHDMLMRVDIPIGFEDISKYNGTLSHKANHNFESNVMVTSMDTPRYGLIAGMVTKQNIKQGEQIFSNYYPQIDPEEAYHTMPETKQWYKDEWMEFKEKHPERIEKYLKNRAHISSTASALNNYL